MISDATFVGLRPYNPAVGQAFALSCRSGRRNEIL